MTKDERKDLAALRDEVRKLREEIELLRGAMTIPTSPWPPTNYPSQPLYGKLTVTDRNEWMSGRSDQTMIGGIDVTELAKLGSMS